MTLNELAELKQCLISCGGKSDFRMGRSQHIVNANIYRKLTQKLHANFANMHVLLYG